MKKISTLMMLILWYASFSQNRQILYGFSEIPQSLLLNPGGKVNNEGYFGVPLLSLIQINGGTSGVTLYDVFADDGIDFNTKLQDAVYNMGSKDFFSFNQQLEVFSGGFAFGSAYDKNKYLSFGLYQELDFILYFPKDYAVLALEGNQNNINRAFNAGHLSTSAELISVLHLGYNKKVNNKFTYGFRGKIYSSILNLDSTKNKGSFVTVSGENNFYDHVFNLNLQLRTSGLTSLMDDDSAFEAKDLTKRVLFGGNLGLGFDLGFTYQLNEQWTLDASLLDVGFISHTKDVENYSVKGDYTFEGVNPVFPEIGGGQTAEEYWSEIEEDFEELFTIDKTTANYTTWRPVKFNTSINYAFGEKTEKECNCIKGDKEYLNAIGLQFFAMSRPKQSQVALTAYYYRKIFKGLRLKAAYTLDSYSFNNLGLGISAHFGSMNFYVMADNFLQYKNIYNAQSVSLQLGFNYIFNRNED